MRRSRKKIKYTERNSFDEEYVELTIKDIPETSSWNKEIMKCFNIEIENHVEPFFSDVSEHPLFLTKWDTKSSQEVNDISNDPKIKTLIIKIKDIMNRERFPEEMYVDGFVSTLLTLMNFDDYPLGMYPQYSYKMEINGKSIGSKVDFAILSPSKIFFLVVEDKTTSNATFANEWKEPQIAGELFVAIHKSITLSTDSYPVQFPISLFATRVIGTQFTFYKATCTKNYVKESSGGFPITNRMKIERYPHIEEEQTYLTAYDFCKPEDRKHIISHFIGIRNLHSS